MTMAEYTRGGRYVLSLLLYGWHVIQAYNFVTSKGEEVSHETTIPHGQISVCMWTKQDLQYCRKELLKSEQSNDMRIFNAYKN
jgi:hypothetical protein